MGKAIGRFLKRIVKSLKKAAEVLLGIPQDATKTRIRQYVDAEGNLVYEEIEEVDLITDTATDWAVWKLVSIIVVASGIFFMTWPASPALAPITASVGGALVNAATDIWRGQEWDQTTSPT